MYQVVNNLSHQAGAHALAPAWTSCTTTTRITYPRSVRGGYTFSSLANFLAGIYNNAGFTQTFGDTSCSQTNRTSASTRRTNGRSAQRLTLNCRPALRPAVSRDDRHRHQQRLAARRVRLDAVRVAATRSSAAAPGSSTIACRCAPSPTRCCRPATRPTSPTCVRLASACRRRRPARRCFRTSSPRVVPIGHARQLDDDGSRTCRTPTRGRRASRSSSRSGDEVRVSVGYQHVARA